jgi:hypothetical protein
MAIGVCEEHLLAFCGEGVLLTDKNIDHSPGYPKLALIFLSLVTYSIPPEGGYGAYRYHTRDEV